MGRTAQYALLAILVAAAPPHTAQRSPPSEPKEQPAAAGPVFDLRAYGARGDGRTDDTAAIQAALDAAASARGTVVVSPSPEPYVFTRVVLRPGVRRFLGQGGVLKILRSDESGNIVLGGKHDGFDVNMSDCVVSGLVIDADHRACVTLRLNGTSRCLVSDNVIRNHSLAASCPGGAAISVRAPLTGGEDASFNRITGNSVFADEDTAPKGLGGRANHCIQLTGEPQYTAPYTDAPSQWKASAVNIDSKFHPSHNVVRDNLLVGGYYGIDLAMARENQVTSNSIISPVRGISIQHSSSGNLVSGNSIVDSRSSGIHLAYGASRNLISGNLVHTNRSVDGEALLQAYLGSSMNTFSGNVVTTGVAARSQYLAYSGPECSDNAFIGNRLSGSPTRAGLAVESGWNSSTSNPAAYAFRKSSAVVDLVAAHDTSGVVVMGNVITITGSPTVPVLFLGQSTDRKGRHALSRVVLAGNTVVHDGKRLELVEDSPGSLLELTLLDNVFSGTATAAEFVLPRGRAHSSVWAGNGIPSGAVSFPEGQSSPSVAVGETFMFPSSKGPQRVTDFVGGAEGQEIVVRLAPGVTIVHDRKRVVCRGATDVAGSVDDFVRFRRVGGVWFEQSRSF